MTTGERIGSWFTHLPPVMQSLVVIVTTVVVTAGATMTLDDLIRERREFPAQLSGLRAQVDTTNMKLDDLRRRVEEIKGETGGISKLDGRISALEEDLRAQKRRVTLDCFRLGGTPEDCLQ